MIEQGLIKSHFVGRDGFIWWIGQITPQKEWGINLPPSKTETTKEQKGFDFRYKVRIMGYHTACGSELPDSDLPWASVMLPVTAGVSGGGISTPNLRQGDFVYGFFLDGEDAQQPIIMGVIGHNQYTAILKNPPEECGFKPFSGFTIKDKVPPSSQTTTQEEPTAVADGVDVNETNNNEVAESPVSNVSRSDGASLEQYTNESKPSTISSNTDCDVAPVGSIQREIKNMIADVQRIQKTATDWRTQVSTTVNDIQGDIDKVKQNTIKAISGDVKRITTELQKNALMKVNDALSESYDKVFPTELPLIKEEADKANSELSCAFRNIMKNLTGMVGNFLNQIMDRFINTPMCAVENFVGSLLGKISGLIDGAVNSVMAPIKSLLAGMGVASSGLDDVMGFATDALSFLSCDQDPKCSDVKEWNPVNGPEITATLDLFSIFSKAKQAAGLVQNAVEGFGNIGDAISDVTKNANFDDVFSDTCNVGPVFCGPPTVEFIGGGGAGTKGNVIVSTLTTLLGVDIITPGGGYIGPPRVRFIDSCDKGHGAKGRAVMGQVPVVGSTTGETTLGVTQIIMDDTGIDYMPTYDGSQGGDGRTWADRDETTIKRNDGTYDIPYKPGTTVTVCPGDEITHPGGQTELITGTDCTGITTKLPPDQAERGRFPSTSTGDYPVVLEIDKINIIDKGFGYKPDDKVIITPSNGAQLKIKTNPVGSIIGVDVINGGIGFVEDPDLYIESDTGYNATLMPVFKVNRIGEEAPQVAVAPTGVIQVIDCVGKF
jgi:hypothetical protein